MNDFQKKVSKKIEKMSVSQIKDLYSSLVNENEALFSVIQSLSIGMIICSKEWNLILANKSAERMVLSKSFINEYSIDSFSDAKIWDYIEDSDISNFIEEASRGKKISYGKEFVIKPTGAQTKFLAVSIEPLVHFQEKKIQGFIIKVEDITDKRNAETLMRRVENMSSLTNLAASVAHEVKNPLGSMSIYIQLLQKSIKKARESDGQLPKEKYLENYLEVVNQEIDRLNRIIVDFLFAVRPISAELLPLNPNELLEKFVEFYKPEFEQKKISFETSFVKECPKILIDEKLFKQAVVNLVQNSISALESLGEQGISRKMEISFETKIENDSFIILISDNGIGMSEETRRRIFEPYFTTKTTGTGLGLTMVYKIIKEFCGEIEVESNVGKGSTFKITLPVIQNDKKLLGEPEK